ncbi:MAG: CCA tRNA nucleotidyltransferase [Candidatus Limnocylindria bacterium]
MADDRPRDGSLLRIQLPSGVERVLSELAAAGAEAVLVGGCVRDVVRGEDPDDWDVATSAPPEAVAARFPGSSWENRFGTVTVRPEAVPGREGVPGREQADPAPGVEVTTYRLEGDYGDRRRPDSVRWGTSLAEDLARRDFTINAMAWRPLELAAGSGRLVDPHGGADDMRAGVLRAVGDPDRRIGEDALRLVRALRFATRFGLALDPATEAAVRRHAALAAELSGERVRDELLRILAGSATPSTAFAMMEELGLLGVLLPELGALRGVPQSKALPGDALDHSLRTADALPGRDPVLRLAGLLHDLGKATTLADGHFIGHESEGARMAATVGRRLRLARPDVERLTRLVRQHMFAYTPRWTDAAVRRFVRRAGTDLLDDLFALRAADNAASGVREPQTGGLAELRRRVDAVVGRDPLNARQLAVNGHDLAASLGLSPGPAIGAILDRLLEAVLEDPALNRRERLLAMARDWLDEAGGGDPTHRPDGPGGGRDGASGRGAATIGDPESLP